MKLEEEEDDDDDDDDGRWLHSKAIKTGAHKTQRDPKSGVAGCDVKMLSMSARPIKTCCSCKLQSEQLSIMTDGNAHSNLRPDQEIRQFFTVSTLSKAQRAIKTAYTVPVIFHASQYQ